mgnify:CR=1 FL=1
MIKLIKSIALKSGSLSYQQNQLDNLFINFENALNAVVIKEILNVTFKEIKDEVILVAIVRIEIPNIDKPKKGGK